MWKLLNDILILIQFNICFTRKASFNWFVVLVMGFMLRTDTLGVTSVIRDLAISPNSYVAMMHFFRSDSWQLDNILKQWMLIVKGSAPIYKEGDMTILVGDGVKQSKEARKMPGVKRLHQESENSSKAEYIFGHLFGSIGVLAGDTRKLFCIPLSLKIHDGIKAIRAWDENISDTGSHVVEMIKDSFNAARVLGPSLVLLDRYFLSVPALKILGRLNKTHGEHLHILTKAKISYKAYTKPVKPKEPKRGRPRKTGDTIKLRELFETSKNRFKKTELKLYGKMTEVEYLTCNLLWGSGLYTHISVSKSTSRACTERFELSAF